MFSKKQNGMNNHHISEALPGAVPKDRNSPQKCPYGLYAEQLSGTAFTVPQAQNKKTWVYRILPSCKHPPFKEADPSRFAHYISNFEDKSKLKITPNQLRWKPQRLPTKPTNFVEGIFTVCGAGSPTLKNGIAIHTFACNSSMDDLVFQNNDGEYLIVPQEGVLFVLTELGKLAVEPGEILVIPRHLKFSVEVTGPTRGYICEIFKGRFAQPEVGTAGPNVFSATRHYLAPSAFYEEANRKHGFICKFDGEFFETTTDFSPFNVVGWSGNYFPYKYDLRKYNTIGTMTFDHPDPSIFCVLTAATDEPGVAVCDFVIFPDRWMVADNTFRPPYYHRNVMSEFMGNIYGTYDAKGSLKDGIY